jgi:hypothetical protein
MRSLLSSTADQVVWFPINPDRGLAEHLHDILPKAEIDESFTGRPRAVKDSSLSTVATYR